MDPSTAGLPRARIIIPVWGAKYVARLDQACLPALLAPGNLPHLAAHFDCELVIVTQAADFEQVRALAGVQAAMQWSRLRLVAMDDVLSHPSYYGYTITHALYRGFTDLGEAAKDVWCLFLNADFIIADGSYRSLVERIKAGERCILAPSYCTIEEDVRPLLESRMKQQADGRLCISPREMAGLIIDHRHFTIRAKIVNSQMYRIDRVDQFYYVVDNDTMLGRQIPTAVVAFRPERVPQEPVAFWDYGVISETCPSGRICVLGDSDDFCMMELRGRSTMSEQLQLGWMDKHEIGRDLTMWTTKDQRACGEFTLVLHRADTPSTLPAGIEALEAYYRDVMQRASPEPCDHRNHYIWTSVVQLHQEWLASRSDQPQAEAPPGSVGVHRLALRALKEAANGLRRNPGGSGYRRMFDLMRDGYRALFGRPPEVGVAHPYAADIAAALVSVRDSPADRAIAAWSVPGAVVAPHVSRWVRNVETLKPEDIADLAHPLDLGPPGTFDLCFLELSAGELRRFGLMHERLRGLVRPGGRIVALYRTRGVERINPRDFALIAEGLPRRDLAVARFCGGPLSYFLQGIWENEVGGVASGRMLRLLRVAFVAAALGPLAWWSNRGQRRRAPGALSRYCTSLLIEVTVL